jgi:glycosyltransferase involved in cell wall biosynthesis
MVGHSIRDIRRSFATNSPSEARFMFLAALVVLVLAAIPAGMMLANLQRFDRACREPQGLVQARQTPVSVLIPARNEESSIGGALESLMNSTHPELEVIVLDDASEDRTAEIVNTFTKRDPRIRLLPSRGLPEGWNGKQNACWQLANHSRMPQLLFLDADVRLTPDALTRMVAEQGRRAAPLVSGFPFQETGTWSEKLLIPLMHYVLLGFLPMDRMRSTTQPGFAAGCGQLFLAERETYFRIGGHSAIADSRHDGIKLPRAYRMAGLKTDIFDATDIARCRMYQSLPQVVRGLLKNATEGIANPRLIVPFSILLLGGAVLPPVLLLIGLWRGEGMGTLGILTMATLVSWLPRFWCGRRFSQPWLGVLLHPFAVAWFVGLQWTALAMRVLRIRTSWRGRV